jgi:general secretion pathway protein L
LAESIWRTNITTAGLKQAARDFASWYAQEARALTPERALAWLTDRGERKLVVRWRDGSVTLALSGQERDSSDEALIAAARAGPTRIVLELPREKFFVRTFEAPVAARAALERTLPRELERKTLFKEGEIFTGHAARLHPRDPEKLQVTQVVLRRDIAQGAIEQAGLTLADLDIARPRADEQGRLPDIALRRVAPRSPTFRRAALALGALGLCLFIAAGTVRNWRAWEAGEQLEQEIVAASAKAATLRKIVSQATTESALLAGLRRARAQTPTLAALFEETTRILPDSAWLFEWRLSAPKPGDHVVELGGLAQSAADLPALFDKSPLFSRSTLTSPITTEAEEKRERFSLQASVRKNRAGTP